MRHGHCGIIGFVREGIREPLPSFKKLSTLRNQGAFLYPNSINQAVPKGAAFFIPTPPEYNGLLSTADRAV